MRAFDNRQATDASNFFDPDRDRLGLADIQRRDRLQCGIDAALETISALDVCKAEPVAIRIEEV